MNKKFSISTIILALTVGVFAPAASAVSSPPEKGQWAFALSDTVSLYSKADKNSGSQEVDFDGEWLSVSDAKRDKNNDLWYKVKVDGQTGWVFQEGIRLKMGGKNKQASAVYERCTNIRRKVMNGTMGGWDETQNGDYITYTSKNGSFMVRKNGNKVEDIYFSAHGESTCTAFLGFNAIGMDRNGLRKKFGPPTMRETPDGEPDVNILSYELSDRNMTLAMYLRRARGAKEAKVERMELYKGKTGDNAALKENLNQDNERSYNDDEESSQADDVPNSTPDDLPDDLPDELPDDVPTDNQKNSSKSEPEKTSLSSSENAAEFLEEKLVELEKIMPNETLEYLDSQTEIDGVQCWEFSSTFNFNETGRYAISPNGKIYEYDSNGDAYIPVK